MRPVDIYNAHPARLSLHFSLLLFLFLVSCLLSCSRQPVYPKPALKGPEVVIDAARLLPESPVFFTHRYRGKKINFFVVKTGDKVLSFLDACAKCYPSKRGYRVEDGYLACRACEVKYPLSNIVKGFGSCFPIRIEGRLQDREYRIPISRLEEAADKF